MAERPTKQIIYETCSQLSVGRLLVDLFRERTERAKDYQVFWQEFSSSLLDGMGIQDTMDFSDIAHGVTMVGFLGVTKGEGEARDRVLLHIFPHRSIAVLGDRFSWLIDQNPLSLGIPQAVLTVGTGRVRPEEGAQNLFDGDNRPRMQYSRREFAGAKAMKATYYSIAEKVVNDLRDRLAQVREV